ncbi:MAG: hypothetical protein J0H41_18730, partial [Rhizobiales bacterium]|nr:hypothetical protein [Hyphomicrobiales bacterium]
MSKTITLRAAPLVLGMAAAVAALASMGAARFLDASPQVAALFGLCAVGFAAIVMELRARRRQTERLADAVGALASGVERAGAQ